MLCEAVVLLTPMDTGLEGGIKGVKRELCSPFEFLGEKFGEFEELFSEFVVFLL